MIVEFTGVPCSGKSFIIKRLISELDIPFKLVYWSKYNPFYNLSLFIRYIYLFTIGKGYFFILKWVFFSQNKLTTKFRLIYNIVKKIDLYWQYNKKDGLYIFDEGISHIIFNVFVNQGLENLDLKKFSILQKELPFVDLIVFVETDKKTLEHRIMKRGHSRLKETALFLEKNLLISKALINYNKSSTNFYKFSNSQHDFSNELKNLIKLLKSIRNNV